MTRPDWFWKPHSAAGWRTGSRESSPGEREWELDWVAEGTRGKKWKDLSCIKLQARSIISQYVVSKCSAEGPYLWRVTVC